MIEYSICENFTDTPGGRYRYQSPYSGEEFREDVLIDLYNQAKQNNTTINMDLDGTFGYPASFLEEAFGGLARLFPDEDVLDRFMFKSDDQPSLPLTIMTKVAEAKKRSRI